MQSRQQLEGAQRAVPPARQAVAEAQEEVKQWVGWCMAALSAVAEAVLAVAVPAMLCLLRMSSLRCLADNPACFG